MATYNLHCLVSIIKSAEHNLRKRSQSSASDPISMDLEDPINSDYFQKTDKLEPVTNKMKSDGENERPGNHIQNCSRNQSAQIKQETGKRCCFNICTDLYATEETDYSCTEVT